VSLKIIMLGNSGVGKSSILKRFTKDCFDEQIEPTIGIDFMVKSMIFGEKQLKLVIWVGEAGLNGGHDLPIICMLF
jgi:Ras-related protein Rab-18